MNEIKRYDIFLGFSDEECESDTGNWCKYSDVKKIIKQNKDLIETIEAMIKIGEAVK